MLASQNFRLFLVLFLVFFIKPCLGYSADVISNDVIFQGIDSAGNQNFLLVHPESGQWKLQWIREAPLQLPDSIFENHYDTQNEALMAAEKLALRQGLQTHSTKSLMHSFREPPTTEVPGQRLWAVQNQWNWGWEQRYAFWIRNEVTPQFFKQYGISTDCADAAYALRWIFARTHALPAANHLSGSGVLFSQDSFKKKWFSLKPAPLWHEDQRFLAALNYLLSLTYTHTLFEDSYPIEISLRSLFEVNHHLSLGESSGHTMIASRVETLPSSFSPLTVFYSTVPRALRDLAEMSYWESKQPTSSGWLLEPQAIHPYFSSEQYSNSFLANSQSFAEAVLLRLNPQMNVAARFAEGLNMLRSFVSNRKQIVNDGFLTCNRNPCRPGSGRYEAWSTPARDERMSDLVFQLEEMLDDLGQKLPTLWNEWQDARLLPILTLNGAVFDMGVVILALKIGSYSSDPNDPIALRWGIEPKPFLTTIKAQFDDIQKKKAAGLDVDEEIQELKQTVSLYCHFVEDKVCVEFGAQAHAMGLDRLFSIY
ncbi:hypothetical protein WDW86_00960 [Bdellovibrionota bacterium FG-2]